MKLFDKGVQLKKLLYNNRYEKKRKTMKEILEKYKVRFYRRQKLAFKNALCEKMEALGYQCEMLSKKIKMVQVDNILVGNFKQAKTIVVVPYDTPARVFWFKYLYFPCNGEKQLRKSFLPIYAPLLISYVILLGIIYILPTYISLGANQIVLSLASTLYLAVLLMMIVKGFANHKNATRNSAAISIAYDIASTLDERKRKEVAFVFTDKNTTKVKGSILLEDYMKSINKGTEKIVLYCIGGGNQIQVGYKKGSRKTANELVKKHNGEHKPIAKGLSDGDVMQLPLEPFDNALQISTGEMEDNTLVVRNTATSKDVEVNEELVEEVKGMVLGYLSSK